MTDALIKRKRKSLYAAAAERCVTMQKIISWILSIAVIFSVLPAVVASAETSGYFTYTVSNGTATITGCDTSVSGDLTVPLSIYGYRVTGIESYAFRSCKLLTSIMIPSGITEIGNYAFQYCESLTSITISDSVMYICYNAFQSCNQLTTINVDSSNINYSSTDRVLFNKNKT